MFVAEVVTSCLPLQAGGAQESSNTGAIIGGVIGGVVGLLLIGAVIATILVGRRRKAERALMEYEEVMKTVGLPLQSPPPGVKTCGGFLEG